MGKSGGVGPDSRVWAQFGVLTPDNVIINGRPPKRLGNFNGKVDNLVMPPKSKRIHLIERDARMIRTEGHVWESGYWAVPEAKAKQLLGGSVLFHKKQREPSFFGGLILNYRLYDKGQMKGRVIFTFEYRADHRGVVAESGGWRQDAKIVGV